MSEYPSLPVFLATHRFDDSSPAPEVFCHESDDSPQVGLKRGPNSQADWEEWVEHANEAWRAGVTIHTPEQLDALPDCVVVLDSEFAAWTKDSTNNLSGLYGAWFVCGFEVPMQSDELLYPVTILWHPDWSKT